ncbi:MAG: flagellar protein FlaG [Ignavibacteriae bacterium]|nr:flagellar protein FlaG [Ignavibacteriota bacterium]
MVDTLQGAVQVASPGNEIIPEFVTIQQTMNQEQPVQKEVIQNKNQKDSDMTKVDFSKLTDRLKEIMNDDNVYLKFDKDKDTDKMILKIINTETKEVIQQIPPEISLKIARYVATMYDNVNITNFQA